MSLTNFRQVCDFNTSFGLAHYDIQQHNIFVENQKLTKLRIDLCKEEGHELTEAIETHNLTEIIDALTDELYVIYGAASSFGVDIDELFKKKLVRKFNETKFGKKMSDTVKNMSCENIIASSGLLDKTITELSNYQLIRKIAVNNYDMFTEQQCCNLNYNNIVETFTYDNKNDKNDKNIYSVYSSLHNTIKTDILTLENETHKQNFNNVVECLCNLLFDTYTMGVFLGIDLDWSFDVVHRSNMSKLCITEEEALLTVNYYKKNDNRYKTPNYRKSVNEKYWVVFNEDSGKILKSVNYTPANFTDCPKKLE